MSLEQLVSRANSEGLAIEGEVGTVIRQEGQPGCEVAVRSDNFVAGHRHLATRMFNTNDARLLRYSFSQLEVDSILLSGVHAFLSEALEGGEPLSRELLACMVRATCRIAGTMQRMVANLERILPTVPSRRRKLCMITSPDNQDYVGKLLLLRGFYHA